MDDKIRKILGKLEKELDEEHFLEEAREIKELCRKYNVPFVINDITLATNPLKVFEYMAMHKPIITTPMPECMKYKSVNIAKNATEFIKILKDIDKINNKNYVKLLDKEAKLNSWEEKANEITNKLIIYENEGVIK